MEWLIGYTDWTRNPGKEISKSKKLEKLNLLKLIYNKHTHTRKTTTMTTTTTYFRCVDIAMNNLVKNPSPFGASILFWGERQ